MDRPGQPAWSRRTSALRLLPDRLRLTPLPDRDSLAAGRPAPQVRVAGSNEVAVQLRSDGGRRPSSSPRAGATALADQLSELARSLESEDDVQDTLNAIVRAAVETVPGAEQASISSVVGRREVVTRATTNDVSAGVDRSQYETQEGPCLDALYEQRTVRVPDLPGERRWPRFVERARELGVGSMLAVQLYVAGDDLGALNLTSGKSDAFDDESEQVALLFAAHAAVALAGAQQQEQLRQALHSRDLIGQAKGILMERFSIDADQAFRLLVRASQTSNRKLTEIAEELDRTGELPRS